MSNLVSQSTWHPTRKWNSMMFATACVSSVQAFIIIKYPEYSNPTLFVPIQMAVVGAIGWLTRDRAA